MRNISQKGEIFLETVLLIPFLFGIGLYASDYGFGTYKRAALAQSIRDSIEASTSALSSIENIRHSELEKILSSIELNLMDERKDNFPTIIEVALLRIPSQGPIEVIDHTTSGGEFPSTNFNDFLFTRSSRTLLKPFLLAALLPYSALAGEEVYFSYAIHVKVTTLIHGFFPQSITIPLKEETFRFLRSESV